MKYYIAISSLNMPDILSTESISPASFYQSRGFGRADFEEIEEFPKACLLLFSRIPYFEIKDEDRYNYPVVLEIEDDEQLKGKLQQVDDKYEVFACNQTIRLTPENCRVLVFEREALNMVRQSCGDDANSKLFDYFKWKISDSRDFGLFDFLERFKAEIVQVPQGDVSRDSNYDRCKGFIYGFYMGILKSRTKYTAGMLKCQKEVYNVVAGARLGLTEVHIQELKELDDQRFRIEMDCPDILERWNKEFGQFVKNRADFDKFLEKIDVYNAYLLLQRGFCQTKGVELHEEYKRGTEIEYGQKFESHVKELLRKDKEEEKKRWNPQEMDVNPENFTVMLDATKARGEDMGYYDLFNKVLNKVCWETGILWKLETSTRSVVAREVLAKVKEIDEAVVPYFEGLAKASEDIINGEFILGNEKNVVWQSLAAFIWKYGKLDEITAYLEKEAFTDYRFVLALWGVLNGYAGMSRGIFNGVHKENPNLYGEVYKLLCGREWKGKLERFVLSESKPSNGEKGTMSGGVGTGTDSWGRHGGVERSLVQEWTQEKFEKALQAGGVNSVKEKVWECYKKSGCRFSKYFWTEVEKISGIGMRKCEKIAEIFGVKLGQIDVENQISSSQQISDKSGGEIVKDKSNDQVKKQITKETKGDVSPTLFFQSSLVSMLNDKSWWEETAEMISDEKVQVSNDPKGAWKNKSPRTQYLIDVEWFVGNHQPTYKGKEGMYRSESKANDKVIERFETYLRTKQNPKNEKQMWLKPYYENVPIEEIIAYLKGKYLDKNGIQ